jgi:hypothetical protein
LSISHAPKPETGKKEGEREKEKEKREEAAEMRKPETT